MTLSVENANTDAAYYNLQYKKANPDTNKKSAYTVKKGDNLWNIAKKHLNKKNASNAEISNMMYSIAKLNKKDSIEKANNLKVNDTIYLPGQIQTKTSNKNSSTATKQSTASNRFSENIKQTTEQINKIIEHPDKYATYTQKALYKYENIEKINDKLYAAHGKAGINYWTDLLSTNNPKLLLEKSYSYKPTPTGLVITKKENDNPYGKTEAYLLVQIDDNGKVKEVSFNSPGVDIYNTHLDYKLDTNGNLSKPNHFSLYHKIEQLPVEKCQGFIDNLQKYVDENLK